ncbi:MAG: hypothetical protein KAY09_00980 [Nitrospira sp.]|nr:hypothetical protein [Nitrospira sp.]
MRRSLPRKLTTIMVSITGCLLTPSLSQSQGGQGHVAVAITNERALGFSTYTGGFFDLP